MLDPDDIPVMEASLSEKGFTVADLCRRAGIAETTWGRWRRGEFMPSFRAWRDITSAYCAMLGGAPKARGVPGDDCLTGCSDTDDIPSPPAGEDAA